MSSTIAEVTNDLSVRKFVTTSFRQRWAIIIHPLLTLISWILSQSWGVSPYGAAGIFKISLCDFPASRTGWNESQILKSAHNPWSLTCRFRRILWRFFYFPTLFTPPPKKTVSKATTFRSNKVIKIGTFSHRFGALHQLHVDVLNRPASVHMFIVPRRVIRQSHFPSPVLRYTRFLS